MTNEQREAIETCKEKIIEPFYDFPNPTSIELKDTDVKAIEMVLSMLQEQQEKMEKKDKQIDLIKEYLHQEIAHCTETIKDYIDDDKEGNKHYIKELKEEREHWKDIEKILQNKQKEELYMNWWKYGLYE